MRKGISAILILLAGCGATSDGSLEPEAISFSQPITAGAADVQNWRLQDVRVVVPPGLSVSGDPAERFPDDRIVWWEDPPGDRPAQVGAIMETATRRGAADLRGQRGVVLEVHVQLFHALTPKARASGWRGWHDVLFSIFVRDARTGAVLASGTSISADLRAYQGARARAADAQGITQKARIQARVAQVVRAWLTSNGADLDRIAQPARRASRNTPPAIVAAPEPSELVRPPVAFGYPAR